MLRSLQQRVGQLQQVRSWSRLFSSSIEKSESKLWEPKKRVSRPTMDKIRALNAAQPEVYNIVTLSKEFKLSVEGVRRILKSKYVPESKEVADRQEKNRYEAMGERRKEFKTKHPEEYQKTNAWKREEEKVQDISSAKKNTWANDTYGKGSWKKVAENTKWSEGTRSVNGEGRKDERSRSFSRSEDGDRRSYNRSRDVGRSFDRSEDGDRRSFNRSESGDRRSYNDRDNYGSDRQFYNNSYNREKDRPRRSYGDRPRGQFSREDGDRPNFNRDRGDRPKFNRDGDDRPRFNRDGDDRPRRQFNRDGGDDRPRRQFNRDGGDDRPRRQFNREDDYRPRRSFNSRDDNNDRPRRSFSNDRRDKQDSFPKED